MDFDNYGGIHTVFTTFLSAIFSWILINVDDHLIYPNHIIILIFQYIHHYISVFIRHNHRYIKLFYHQINYHLNHPRPPHHHLFKCFHKGKYIKMHPKQPHHLHLPHLNLVFCHPKPSLFAEAFTSGVLLAY